MDGDNREGLEREGLVLVCVMGFNDEKICEDFPTGFVEGRGKGFEGGVEKREGLEEGRVRSSLITFLPSEAGNRWFSPPPKGGRREELEFGGVV